MFHTEMRAEPFLTDALSKWIECFRGLAAVAVLFSHLVVFSWFDFGVKKTQLGHSAVVFFFVLSGLLVTHSYVSKAQTLGQYSVARLSRIYSVALPAVLGTVLIQYFVYKWVPIPVPNLHAEVPFWLQGLCALGFLSQVWLLNCALGWNEAYWSLVYEAWYYLAFAVFVYAPKTQRFWWFALVFALAGPKIWVLAPTWLLGVALYLWGTQLPRGRTASMLYLGFGLFGVGLIIFSGVGQWLQQILKQAIPGFWKLNLSQVFLTDYVNAIAYGLVLLGIRGLKWPAPRLSIGGKSLFAVLANASFSIYLYHFPLLALIALWIPAHNSPWKSILIVAAVVSASIVLAAYTEQKRHVLVRWMRRLGIGVPSKA